MRSTPPRRSYAALVPRPSTSEVVACAALGVTNWLMIFLLARATQPPPWEEYFLTEYLAEAWRAHPLWLVPVQAAMGWVAARAASVRWQGALVAGVGAYILAVLVEFARDETSHNLIPFELGRWAVVCAPLALGALLGRWKASTGAAPSAR